MLSLSYLVAENHLLINHSEKALASGFDPNNIISDGIFTNYNTMSISDIQAFFESMNSVLKNYVVPDDWQPGPGSNQTGAGKSAAELIYNEAQEHHINPQVILVTLAKEQGFFTSSDPDGFYGGQDYALRWAVGYGVYSGSPYMDTNNSNYSGGFGRQIAYGVWWYRNYYDKMSNGECITIASASPSCVRVGDTTTIRNRSWIEGDYTSVTIQSKVTAILYRYTPYVYNGNYNFWYFFDKWFTHSPFEAAWVSQNGYPALWSGESYQFEVTFRNTGTLTWEKGTVFLGTNAPRDRTPFFVREGDGSSGWFSPNRIWMVENTVNPRENGTFRFWMKVPDNAPSGVYRENFQLVADGITWMNDLGVYWEVTVKSEVERYHYQYISQSSYPTISPGIGNNFQLTIKNTGTAIWYKGTVNLGTDRSQDRIPSFIRADLSDPNGHPSHWISPNRIIMNEDSVAPGENATYSFWMSAPTNMSSGTYREYFRPVVDGISWMEDYGIYWDVAVDYPHAKWVGQSSYPNIQAGGKTAVWVDFQNTGQTTWNKYSLNPINLGTDQPHDRNSSFYYTDWASSNRIALDQNTVEPGQVGRFSFFINVPSGTPAGTYREYFRPVAEGVSWMEDYGVYFNITVL